MTAQASAGADASLIALLSQVEVQIADLSGSLLGMASSANIIWIDRDAAGFGWSPDAQRQSGRMDLQSAVSHEFGHLLGFDHDDHAHGVMAERLAPGTNWLPSVRAMEHHNAQDLAAVDLLWQLTPVQRTGSAWRTHAEYELRHDATSRLLSSTRGNSNAWNAAAVDLVFQDISRGLFDEELRVTADRKGRAGDVDDDELDLLPKENADASSADTSR